MTTPSERLRAAREAAGYKTAPAAAAALGIAPPTYMAHENGSRGFGRNVARYAKLFRVGPEWLMYGVKAAEAGAQPASAGPMDAGRLVKLDELRAYIKDQESRPKASAMRMRDISRRVPVMGEVAAGLWRDAVPRLIGDAEEYLPIDVPGYERAQLTAMRVVGPSMDLVYPPGRYVVIAHPAEAGLRVGDYVVVERYKADLVEITLKEFVSEDGRIALWPRSSHPDFQTPIYLKDGGELDQTAPQIVGVVVADYGKRERPALVFEPKPAGSR